MNNEHETKSNRSGKNYWFYSTIVLLIVALVAVTAFTAYYVGHNSAGSADSDTEKVSLKTNTSSQMVNSHGEQSSRAVQPTNSINISSAPVGNIPTTLNGEIFVVTKGRENIKLALVEVCALSEPTILNWIKQKQERGNREAQNVKAKIVNLKDELNSIETDLNATYTTDSGSRESRYSLEDSKRQKTHEITLAEIAHYYWFSPEHYLNGISGCKASTKSDSDGRFRLELSSNRRYAIAAQTSRKILNSSETYWWLLWINPSTQSIALNNDNLMSENPGNRIMLINAFIPTAY